MRNGDIIVFRWLLWKRSYPLYFERDTIFGDNHCCSLELTLSIINSWIMFANWINIGLFHEILFYEKIAFSIKSLTFKYDSKQSVTFFPLLWFCLFVSFAFLCRVLVERPDTGNKLYVQIQILIFCQLFEYSLLKFSVPQFIYLPNGDNNISFIRGNA